jgi:uncharacterized protein (TIGR02145 family)
MKKKIQILRKGFTEGIIPVVLIAVLLSVTFQSCQKDEGILDVGQAASANQAGQLKSASISSASQSLFISTVLINNLISKINGYVTSGELQSGIANALVSKLENAIKSVDKGNKTPAMNQLEAAINQVGGLVGAGTIDTTIGNGIIFDIHALAFENPTFTDPRDGKVYKTIKIGDQIWMAENLAYLPSVSPTSATSSSYPDYYVYGYSGTDTAEAKATDNYKTYGVLYNWAAAKTACPEGWHMPSKAEWKQLENYLIDNGYGFGGSGDNITKSLAATTNWDYSSTAGTPGNDLSSNNSSGFSALPGGWLDSGGISLFRQVGIAGLWWSSTEDGNYYALRMELGNSTSEYYLNNEPKIYGFSVRCIRNN